MHVDRNFRVTFALTFCDILFFFNLKSGHGFQLNFVVFCCQGFGQISSYLWTGAITWTVYKVTHDLSFDVKKYIMYYHAIIWVCQANKNVFIFNL